MRVPYFDFTLAPEELKSQWRAALLESLENHDHILGQPVSDFETKWANFIGSDYGIGVGNGFDGLVLALRALGLTNGFKVAVPAHTFIASWNSVHFAGGIPVGIDVDSDGLIDLNQLENLQSPPDVVMPVHMHGRMVNMHRLRAWAELKNVIVLEDASQAHGAVYMERYAGSWGDVSVFSLYPTKNLGAFGDAGIVCTNRSDIAERIRSLRNYGASETNKYFHQRIGLNSRLDSIQARILLVNLQNLHAWNQRRREIANIYMEGLRSTSYMTLPTLGKEEIVWHHFAIMHDERDELKSYLKSRKIESEIHYPHSAGIEYGNFHGQIKNYKMAETIAKKILSLPISPWHSDSQIEFTIKAINEFHAL